MNGMTEEIPQAVVHIRFEGKSQDISVSELDVGQASTDEQIKSAVASFLDVEPAKLENYVIERHENGNYTVRPEAVFGKSKISAKKLTEIFQTLREHPSVW